MAERNRPHVVVPYAADAELYTPPPRGRNGPPLTPPQNRAMHARRLSRQLQRAEAEAARRRAERGSAVAGSRDGFYVAFDSFPEVELALQKLDSRMGKVHPELVSAHVVETPAGTVQRAIVFVPEGKLQYFLSRLEQYSATVNDEKPRNEDLIDRIREVRIASLEALWTDPPDQFPSRNAKVWWEVWLRRRDGHEAERFRDFANTADVTVGSHTLGFADRIVLLAHATAEQLAQALDSIDDLAELRRPHEASQFVSFEPPAEQAAWVDQLFGRVRHAKANAPAVTILDSGVSQKHPLLEGSLAVQDCHTYQPTWGVNDRIGHGTEMAGLALYGDLGTALLASGEIHLHNVLESVKILPPQQKTNPPELYGAITATAASLVEIEAPERQRVFALAVSAEDVSSTTLEQQRRIGQPTSWSAAIDALAAGRSVDINQRGLVYLNESEDAQRRLFIVSAGNVRHFEDDHLARSDLEPIEDPGQAWNALTVGAYTEMDSLVSARPDWAGYKPLSPRGELSPHSRTSVLFDPNWPVKPDVLFEGGNVAKSPSGKGFDTPEELQLLTTKSLSNDTRLLTVTCATSAATAQAANLAAGIISDYPSLWAETVRALIVHSAEWTQPMWSQIRAAARESRKVAATRAIYRRYGMGVPDITRATRSAADALTLVVQDAIHPFSGGKMREMHLHDLPWPTDVLTDLGEVQVRLRVTLSYFIEPNPGRRGWRRRYSYASHGLRFEVRRPEESNAEFRKRVNKLALAEEEKRPSVAPETGWILGPTLRTGGSLHADIWEGRAVDLASRGALAVFPVTGWWKENPARDRSDSGARYALVVSVETPDQEVDVWTPVALQVGVPIDIEV